MATNRYLSVHNRTVRRTLRLMVGYRNPPNFMRLISCFQFCTAASVQLHQMCQAYTRFQWLKIAQHLAMLLSMWLQHIQCIHAMSREPVQQWPNLVLLFFFVLSIWNNFHPITLPWCQAGHHPAFLHCLKPIQFSMDVSHWKGLWLVQYTTASGAI